MTTDYEKKNDFSDAREQNNISSYIDKNVLIIGDWFIDEHWTMGIHRSATSSRTGKGHYRALQEIGSEVRAFCGAGRTAFFLHQVRVRQEEKSQLLFKNITGLGFWHHEDTNDLYTLFDPKFQAHSPYRLRDKDTSKMPLDGLKLINMNDVLMSEDNRNKNAFTNRIIRIYSTTKDGKITFDRYDWEPHAKRVDWSDEKIDQLVHKIEDKPSVIIVKDLLKGAVNRKLIERLASEYKGARWYISSKKWKPDWLDTLKRNSVKIELLLVPHVAAQEALATENITYWLSHSEHPSKEALDIIQGLYEKSGARSIIVLPEGLSAIGRISEKGSALGVDDALCVIQPAKKIKPVKVPMGEQSILFPALCSGIEYSYQNNTSNRAPNIPNILAHAFECTSDWISAEGERVLNPASWKPDPHEWEPKPSILEDVSCIESEPKRVTINKKNNWNKEINDWESAENNEKFGVIIKGNNHRELQLSRSMTEVNGYVCWGQEKRKYLSRLVKGINDFHNNSNFPAAAMLIAEPGSGKSFLITRLAKSAELEPLTFNITHLSSRGEIISWFDTIHAKQQEMPDKKFLIFIDEINSDLDGGKPYSAFLSPLEDGFYVRNGQINILKPAVWIFAGTENPIQQQADKGSDFMSRMTLGAILLSHHTEPNYKELERIYFGVAMLNSIFHDVKFVSEDVLRAFQYLGKDADVRARDIKHFVRQFSNIQYARVTSANVPDCWPKDEQRARYNMWKRNISSKEEANIEIVP